MTAERPRLCAGASPSLGRSPARTGSVGDDSDSALASRVPITAAIGGVRGGCADADRSHDDKGDRGRDYGTRETASLGFHRICHLMVTWRGPGLRRGLCPLLALREQFISVRDRQCGALAP